MVHVNLDSILANSDNTGKDMRQKIVVCMDNNSLFCSFSSSVRGPETAKPQTLSMQTATYTEKWANYDW